MKRKEKLRFLYLFLMGIAVFSPLSSEISLRYLRLPISMPELFAVPFCYLLWQDVKKVCIDKRLFANLMILMMILIVFGILYGSFSAYAIIGSARAYFWLFLFYCIFKSKENPFTLEDIMYVSFGSIIGWMFSALLGIRSMIMSLMDYQITYGALLAIPLFLSTSYIRNKNYLLILGIVAIWIICVLSGVRRLIFISLLSVFLISFYSIIKKPTKFVKIGIGFVLFLTVSLAVLPYVRNTAQDVSHLWYHRVFERSEVYLEGDIDSSDEGRLNSISDLIEHSWEYILPPRGFVSRQTSSDIGAGDFNDVPLKELFWTFSLPGALFLIFHFSKRTYIHWKRFRRFEMKQSFVIVTCMTIMFVLLFLEGTFLAYPYATPITGICLGLADRNTL